MIKPVMAILHWEADRDTALERYERAVAAWRQTFGDLSSGPLHAIAGRSERGGLVVVNVFRSNEDHLAFGRNMGDPLAAVDLPTPAVEHVCRSAASAGQRSPIATTWIRPQLAESEHHGLAGARCELDVALVVHG
jgi:hypothetical protein